MTRYAHSLFSRPAQPGSPLKPIEPGFKYNIWGGQLPWFQNLHGKPRLSKSMLSRTKPLHRAPIWAIGAPHFRKAIKEGRNA